MLTRNKKQYGGMIYAQEGRVLDKPKFDVKGLSIKKVQTPKIARKVFLDILKDDILMPPRIDQMGVFMKFLDFEKRIKGSLLSGESSFLKPSKYSAPGVYKLPYQQQSVRGVMLWNALFPDRTIPDFSNVNLVKMRRLDRDEAIEKFGKFGLGEAVEGYFEDLMDLEVKTLRAAKKETDKVAYRAIDVIAVPKDVETVPEEICPFIDVSYIVDGNMKNGNILLESCGFKIVKSLKQDTFTNLLNL